MLRDSGGYDPIVRYLPFDADPTAQPPRKDPHISPARIARDLALLIARVGLGIILIAHGWQKLSGQGLAATADGFQQMGVPLPTISACYATFAELVGGVAILLGLALPIAGVIVALDMAGALVLVHLKNGLFVNEGGYELVLAIAVGALALAAAGSGRLGIDHHLLGRNRAKEADAPVSG